MLVSVFQDSGWLLDVGVVGLMGTSLYLYRNAMQQKEVASAFEVQLHREKATNEALQAHKESIQKLYTETSDRWSRTVQELKTTKEESLKLEANLKRLRNLVELQKTAHLGNLGEGILKGLLERAESEGLIESFELQPRILQGNLIPDAIATMKNGRKLVIDSKAVDKQTMDAAAQQEDSLARQHYVRNLKAKMTDLHTKGYPSQVNNSYNSVWMFLPHDRDLQKAYNPTDATFSDDLGLHEHARKQNVHLVGPESFLSSLRTLNLIRLENEQYERQSDADVTALLGPALTDVMKQYRKTENAHRKLISQHNSFVQTLEKYHDMGQEVLNSEQSLSKRSLPKGLDRLVPMKELEQSLISGQNGEDIESDLSSSATIIMNS